MRISDWSSDVCSSDLADRVRMPDIDWIYTRALPAAATGLGRAVDIGWRRLTGGCSALLVLSFAQAAAVFAPGGPASRMSPVGNSVAWVIALLLVALVIGYADRKSTRLNSSH